MSACDDSSPATSAGGAGAHLGGAGAVAGAAGTPAGAGSPAGAGAPAGAGSPAGAGTSAGTSAGATPEPARLDGRAPAPRGQPSFSFPVGPDHTHLMRPYPVIGVDHDLLSGVRTRCSDHHGRAFPFCYDDHDGSDFILDGGFATMDAGSARVVAAAAGRVTRVEDGNYDRCHADLLSADVTCDGHPITANLVYLAHEGGWETRYLHLRSGSVRVRVGQEVACGEELGLVGSSGYSSAPHLHFEVRDDLGRVRDPFEGPESQPYSMWVDEVSPGDAAPAPSEPTSALPAARCAP